MLGFVSFQGEVKTAEGGLGPLGAGFRGVVRGSMSPAGAPAPAESVRAQTLNSTWSAYDDAVAAADMTEAEWAAGKARYRLTPSGHFTNYKQ